MEPLPDLEGDGLYTPEVGPWSWLKYRLISNYAEIFTTSMKGKWTRAYVDLFAGAGRGRIRGSARIIPTSAMLALGVRNPFDRYVFCDMRPACTSALADRVRAAHPEIDCRVLTGDANQLAGDVLAALSERQPGMGVLTFCVLDPFNLALQFETVRRLATGRVDFLVLIPSYMDANRNLGIYFDERSSTVAEFLGDPEWRHHWPAARGGFGRFIVDQFGRSMSGLGFIYRGPSDTVAVRPPKANRPIYHLAFFSKHELAVERFWRETRKYSDPQLGLFS